MVYHVTTTQIFPAAPSDSNTALLVWSSADPVQVPPTNALDLEVDAVIGEGAVSKLNATAMTSPDSMTMAAAAEAMTNGDDNPRRASLSQSPHRNDSELAQTQNAVEETLPGGGIVSFAASPTRDLDGGPEPLEDATSVVMESEQTADVPSNSGPVLPEVAHVAFDAPLNHDTVPIPQNVAENLADWSEAQVPETSLILPEGELLDQNLISSYENDHAQNLLALQNGGDMNMGMAMQMGIGMDMGMGMGLGLGSQLAAPYLEPSPQVYEELQSSRVSAYAKLVFDDGEFYMNTYSIVLGRDVNAAKNALRREKEEERARLESEASARAPIPHTPRLKKEGSRYTKSIVSESGGILRDGNDSDDEEDRRRRKSRRSKKASKRSKSSESSQHLSRRNSLAHLGGQVVYNTYAQAPAKRAALDTAVPVDPETLKPSPHDCPLVGIHPAAKDGVHAPHSAYKSISRRHVKIAYNIRKNYWEAEILGRNGTFIDDKFCHYEQVICLNSGSVLQVGGVVVTFLLPDIPIGKTGAEKPEFEDNVSAIRHSIGGKEMSFDFEDDPREGGIGDSSEGEVEGRSADIESDDEDERERNGDSVDDQEAQDDEEDEDEGEEASYQSIPMDTDEAMLHTPQQQGDLVAMPPKKRGPGRPPKNGIMSKREQQLAKKEALAREREGEMDKSAKPANGQPTVPGKNKVGRPRKHPRPDTPPEPREKRKYTKRKPKEPKEGDAIKQDGSGGEEAPAKEKKEKKPPKPERSPSPTFVESELTEQQLAKPQANYVTLIYEALHESKNGQMSLPQIYRAIQRKYPYFVLKVPTNGWQSSVRHNLSQHHAFRKIERDGKGWMWGIVPGVSIEKEKKKRASPPPQSHPGLLPQQQAFYQPGHPPHIMPFGQHGTMGPPPGYPMQHQLPPNYGQGQYPGQPPLQHPQYIPQPPHMNGHSIAPGPNHQVHPMHINAQHAPPFMPPVAPQLMANTGGTYSSPYGPKPTQTDSPKPPQPQMSEQKPPPVITSPPKNADQPVAPTPPAPVEKESPSSEDFRSAIEGSVELNAAVERFKTNLIDSLKITKTLDPEKIVNSAINRVLGRATVTSVPGDSEALITRAFKNMLVTNMSTLKYTPNRSYVADPPRDQERKHSSPQPLANQNGTQTNAAQHTTATTARPIIMRPTFSRYGPNRSGPTSIPRPPMTTPGIRRTESGSPATTSVMPRVPSSASPVPSASHLSTSGASALQPAADEAPPVVASVPCEALPAAGVKKEQLVDEQAVNAAQDSRPFNPSESSLSGTQIIGQKREREPDMDEMPDAKKLAISAPPELTA